MLVEREVDAKLLLECIASYLVCSARRATRSPGPNYDPIWNFVAFEQQQLVDMKSLCMASYLVLSMTSAAIPCSKLRSDL